MEENEELYKKEEEIFSYISASEVWHKAMDVVLECAKKQQAVEKEFAELLKAHLPPSEFEKAKTHMKELKDQKNLAVEHTRSCLVGQNLDDFQNKVITRYTENVLNGHVDIQQSREKLYEEFSKLYDEWNPSRVMYLKLKEGLERQEAKENPPDKVLFSAKFYGMELYVKKSPPEKQKGQERNRDNEKEK